MKVYVQQATVKKVEERFREEWAGGMGKEAKTKHVSDGWWVTFNENMTAIRCDTKPECEAGDIALCTWEFKKP
jgi:hypothetical protein